MAELYLLLADRSQHVYEKIIPYLKKNYIVISDRYADSSIAYQSAGRNINNNLVNKFNKLATNNVKPCLTFLLHTDLQKSIQKAKKLSKEFNGGDRIERESLTFHKKVKKEYDKLQKSNKNRIIKIKLKKNIKDTQKIIQEITIQKLEKANFS